MVTEREWINIAIILEVTSNLLLKPQFIESIQTSESLSLVAYPLPVQRIQEPILVVTLSGSLGALHNPILDPVDT